MSCVENLKFNFTINDIFFPGEKAQFTSSCVLKLQKIMFSGGKLEKHVRFFFFSGES